MAKRINIGATLVLNSGNFFANIKSAVASSGSLTKDLNGAAGSMKKTSSAGITHWEV